MNLHREGYKELYLSVFVSLFFFFYVISEATADSVSPIVFPLEVQLARGEEVPLTPLFLSTFYRCLNSIKLEMERFEGRYDVATFFIAFFLQVVLYERFLWFAHRSLTFSHTHMVRRVGPDGVPFEEVVQCTNPFILRWEDYSTSGNIVDFMCSVDHFIARPYNSSSIGVIALHIFTNASQRSLRLTRSKYALVLGDLSVSLSSDVLQPERVAHVVEGV
ncbi:hypothetical protein U1Q18_005092 [Sarracenia purpurea var. burkii]